MTRRRQLEHHRQGLAEIREIMNSMKTLAYMESRKLARFLDVQHAVIEGIEDVAADFLGFYPETLPAAKEAATVYLLIGTERGFCGDFNHALLKYMETELQAQPSGSSMLIAVGRKLHTLLEGDTRVAASIDGAGVLEEVTSLINQLVDQLTALQKEHGALAVSCLYHGADDEVVTRTLLPPFKQLLRKPPHYPHPPVLNQPPREFLADLTDHYLFAALHEMLYTSLMMENQHRVAHLEGAVRHLDEESAGLARRSNALRQEEIIEEIEVILLSAASLDEKPAAIRDEAKGNEQARYVPRID